MELPRIRSTPSQGTTAHPLMAEDVPLRPLPAAAGFAAGAAAVVAGHVISRAADHPLQDVAAGAIFVIGLTVAVFVVICRHFHTVVTTRTVEGASGPFRVVVPTGSVETAERRPATAWRRLYSTEEVEIRYPLGTGRVVIPSRRAEDLVAALDEETGS